MIIDNENLKTNYEILDSIDDNIIEKYINSRNRPIRDFSHLSLYDMLNKMLYPSINKVYREMSIDWNDIKLLDNIDINIIKKYLRRNKVKKINNI